MFDLVFLFSGLCGFVLQPPGAFPAAKLDVVLALDADHEPTLVIHKDHRVGAIGLPKPIDIPDLQDYFVYPLDGKGVRVLNGAETGGVRWKSASKNETGCPTWLDLDSYDWVVPMSRITPGNGRAAPACSSAAINAMVELEAGELAVRSFARNDHDQVLKWRFMRGPGTWFDTALADLVEVRQGGLSDRNIEIALDDCSTGDIGILTLKPVNSAITVQVLNLPLSDICCLHPENLKVGDRLPHFDQLFKVLPSMGGAQKPVGSGYCPTIKEQTPSGLCSRTCTRASGNPQCPGADMSNP